MIWANGTEIRLDFGVLDVLMPMHAVIGRDLRLVHVGPTLRRLRPDAPWNGETFGEVFEVRRPRGFCIRPDAAETAQVTTVHVQLREGGKTILKGDLAYLPARQGVLMQFGFGIGVVDAVRAYDLSASDFAATDLTVEMLYLVEAKSAAMEESRDLNRRLQAAKRAAELQAQTDSLTGVRNRRALEAELSRLIDEGTPFALVNLDLDFFKTVNDTMGHAAGDHVLKRVADILVEEMRTGDFIARVGGDEFVLVLPELTTEASVDALAQRIIRRIQEPIVFDGAACTVAASIGSTRTSLYERPTLKEMGRDADNALYQSKLQGRGIHTSAPVCFDPEARGILAERRAGA